MANEIDNPAKNDLSYEEAYQKALANKLIEKSFGDFIRQSEKKHAAQENDARTMKRMWIGATIITAALLSSAVLLGVSRAEEQKKADELSKADDNKIGMIDKLNHVDSPISVLSGEYQIPSSQTRYNTPSFYGNPVHSYYQSLMEYGIVDPKYQRTFYSNVENPPVFKVNETLWALDKIKVEPENAEQIVFVPLDNIKGLKQIVNGVPTPVELSELEIKNGVTEYTDKFGKFDTPILGFKADESDQVEPLLRTTPFDEKP